MAPLLAFPNRPEVIDRRTAKENCKVEGDTAGDDQHKAELDQPPCQGDVAEEAVIEEQDGQPYEVTARDV